MCVCARARRSAPKHSVWSSSTQTVALHDMLGFVRCAPLHQPRPTVYAMLSCTRYAEPIQSRSCTRACMGGCPAGAQTSRRAGRRVGYRGGKPARRIRLPQRQAAHICPRTRRPYSQRIIVNEHIAQRRARAMVMVAVMMVVGGVGGEGGGGRFTPSSAPRAPPGPAGSPQPVVLPRVFVSSRVHARTNEEERSAWAEAARHPNGGARRVLLPGVGSRASGVRATMLFVVRVKRTAVPTDIVVMRGEGMGRPVAYWDQNKFLLGASN